MPAQHQVQIMAKFAAVSETHDRVAQADEELAADPFSCDALAMAMDGGSGRGKGPAVSLADVDARLSSFAAEHTWDADGLLCDFGCATPLYAFLLSVNARIVTATCHSKVRYWECATQVCVPILLYFEKGCCHMGNVAGPQAFAASL